ncbi:hypothetical protein [Bacillus thuringiensis]|uniref:hypothetical protein n=1 Tax=Bacillus thuringiensis TaxID=1428 RepID=UPI0021D6836B|nr:hypothetical protein [Bacillus thuringiensis]MCU7667507.1 hypothetical protein [Bacillus thuringiensis]
MQFEKAKKQYRDAEHNRIKKWNELELANEETEIALQQVQSLCPHKTVTGKLIKWCLDCGHAAYFWKFNKSNTEK